MNNILQALRNIQLRNQVLPQNLISLKNDLESVFEKTFLQAGVINPGYYSFFLPVLENYRVANLITRYHITEEQYTNGTTGNLVKIPVVDVFLPDNATSSIRIFIVTNNFLKLNNV
jgi:hypothetical protein